MCGLRSSDRTGQTNCLPSHPLWALISSRTKAALAAKKQRGERVGNPRLTEVSRAGRDMQAERADQFAANLMLVIDEIRTAGVTTLRGIAEALNPHSPDEVAILSIRTPVLI